MYKSYLYPLMEQKDTVKQTVSAVYDLTKGLTGKVVYRGTHEATLCEAQGGRLPGNGLTYFDHHKNLKEQRERITKNGAALRKGLSQVENVSSGVHHRLNEMLLPLLNRRRLATELALSTEQRAYDLSRTFGNRLEGYPLRTGDRAESDIVSRQMEWIHQTYGGGRFEKELLPNVDDASAVYLEKVRKLPVNHHQATAQLAPAINHLHLYTLRHEGTTDPSSREELGLFIRPLKLIVDITRDEPYAKAIPDHQVEAALVDAIANRKLK